MKPENQQKFGNLAYDLHKMRTSASGQVGAYILFLGGDASTVQGRPFLEELRQQILKEPRGSFFSSEQIQQMSLPEQIDKFEKKWLELRRNSRTDTLYALQKKVQPTTGHLALASLLRENYFSLLLTTIMDQLVESTFISSSMKNGQSPPPWKVLENGVNTLNDLQRLFQAATPMAVSAVTTILKLCGSINMGSFVVTGTEVEEKIQDILSSMAMLFQRDLIIVGNTYLDDLIFQRLFQTVPEREDIGSIYYINTREPSPSLAKRLNQWETIYIVEEEMTFDVVFQTIKEQVEVFQKVEDLGGGAPLDQAGFERLSKQRIQTGDDAVVEYFKSSAPQQAPTSPFLAEPEPFVAPFYTEAPVSAASTEAVSNEDVLFELIGATEPVPVHEPVPVEEETNDTVLVKLIKDTTVVNVSIRADAKASFTIISKNTDGPASQKRLNYTSKETSRDLDFNLAALNQQMHYMGESLAAFHKITSAQGKVLRDGWRQQAKSLGLDLYDTLIKPIPEFESALAVARGTAAQDDPSNVTLVFEGPRQFLSMPYELLYYRDTPLVLQHPLCRKVQGVPAYSEHFDDFFYNLRKRRQPFRVLLIASATPGIGSDEQINALEKFIDQAVRRLGVKPIIHKLLTKQASIDTVRKRLRKCTYHVVHYAGHGLFDEATGENSGLRFWQRDNMQGERVTLTARELASLLEASETRFFYLNACVGAELTSEQALTNNDYLGTMDAIVKAGVPYVLGFRWYVTDQSSRTFANLFYQHFFTRPLAPELAVLTTRKRIYEEDALNETWSSPILVAQTPYQ